MTKPKETIEAVFPIPITDLKKLTFSTKTGELELDVILPHPAGDIPLRLLLSEPVTKALALNLARMHKFLDEQLELAPVTNDVQ